MHKRNKIIIACIIIAIVIVIIVVTRSGKNVEINGGNNNSVESSNNNEITVEMVSEKVKEKLESGNLVLENSTNSSSLYGSRGVAYTVYEDDKSLGDIEVYELDSNLMRRVKDILENNECIIDGVKYIRYENSVIKISENESLNSKIKQILGV